MLPSSFFIPNQSFINPSVFWRLPVLALHYRYVTLIPDYSLDIDQYVGSRMLVKETRRTGFLNDPQVYVLFWMRRSRRLSVQEEAARSGCDATKSPSSRSLFSLCQPASCFVFEYITRAQKFKVFQANRWRAVFFAFFVSEDIRCVSSDSEKEREKSENIFASRKRKQNCDNSERKKLLSKLEVHIYLCFFNALLSDWPWQGRYRVKSLFFCISWRGGVKERHYTLTSTSFTPGMHFIFI